jgi:hypothetical protein
MMAESRRLEQGRKKGNGAGPEQPETGTDPETGISDGIMEWKNEVVPTSVGRCQCRPEQTGVLAEAIRAKGAEEATGNWALPK